MSGRAQVIDELETTIPVWLRRRNPQWYPKFVHILTVRLGPDTVCCNSVRKEAGTAAAAAAM